MVVISINLTNVPTTQARPHIKNCSSNRQNHKCQNDRIKNHSGI